MNNKVFLESFFEFMENNDLLTEEGIEAKEFNLSDNDFKLSNRYFNKKGNLLLENYYSKWRKNNPLNTINEYRLNEFWFNRLDDINYLTKLENLSESSMLNSFINKNMIKDIDLFLESLDYNIPKNTDRLELNFQFKGNNIFLECLAYNKNNKKIKNNNLRMLENRFDPEPLFLNEDNKFNIFTYRKGMNEIKDYWYNKDRVYNKKIEFNFIDR